MIDKNIYCTLDTETFGGASKPKGIYHLGGFIHDRKGNVLAGFNYLISEHYSKIEHDTYAKSNFHRYAEMVKTGIVTMISTEKQAVDMVDRLCDTYDVKYMMAFNSGFDYCKTKCSKLLKFREFIDLYLVAVQTIANTRKYIDFCHKHNLCSKSKKSVSTSAETFYAYLTNEGGYVEEHTALEDSKIEMAIFLASMKAHKAFTKNCHFFDYANNGNWSIVPKWNR